LQPPMWSPRWPWRWWYLLPSCAAATKPASGGTVDFSDAQFSGRTLDFSRVADWSHPPEFGWDGPPPPGVRLPAKGDGEP